MLNQRMLVESLEAANRAKYGVRWWARLMRMFRRGYTNARREAYA